jgi:hypothetical protein
LKAENAAIAIATSITTPPKITIVLSTWLHFLDVVIGAAVAMVCTVVVVGTVVMGVVVSVVVFVGLVCAVAFLDVVEFTGLTTATGMETGWLCCP